MTPFTPPAPARTDDSVDSDGTVVLVGTVGTVRTMSELLAQQRAIGGVGDHPVPVRASSIDPERQWNLEAAVRIKDADLGLQPLLGIEHLGPNARSARRHRAATDATSPIGAVSSHSTTRSEAATPPTGSAIAPPSISNATTTATNRLRMTTDYLGGVVGSEVRTPRVLPADDATTRLATRANRRLRRHHWE